MRHVVSGMYGSIGMIVLVVLAQATSSSAGLWQERLDARSFPDGIAQRVLERGPLDVLVGATGSSPDDTRDAFAIRVVDPAAFSVAVEADFDAQILLFAVDGSVVAAGRDPSPAGSGGRVAFSFAPVSPPPRPGEYVIVVAAAGDDPRDFFDRVLLQRPDGLGRRPAAGAVGVFDHWSADAPPRGGSYRLALAGAEGAGFLDVVLAVDETKMDRYCLGTETDGDFHCHGVTGDRLRTVDVELGDFNNDGHLDAVFATRAVGERNRICPGDGVGRFSFSECLEFGPTGLSSRGVAVGDLDLDENLDVVVATDNSGNLSCLGDGALGFSCVDIEAPTSHSRHAELGLLDDDGFLDVVIGNRQEPNRACLGLGNGSFASCTDVSADEGWYGLTLGELTGDPHLDLVFLTSHNAQLCPGDGAGAFSGCSELVEPTPFTDFIDVAAALIDADSNLDLFLLQDSTIQKVCLGDGTGGFACDSSFCEGNIPFRTTEVALADFDGDGAVDAAISADPDPGEIWFGDGTGSFGVCAKIDDHGRQVQGLAVGALAPASVGWDDFETGDLRAWAFSEPE